MEKIVNDLVTEVNSSATIADIDKLHRNGPRKGDQQDVIVRFKSHGAKEAFYKARKELGANRGNIKIRPSLSSAQKNLLNDARDYLDTLKDVILDNPPDFVCANIHGNIQVKMKRKCKDGLFFSFNNIDQLTRIISKANLGKESFRIFDIDNSWADDRDVASDSSDDDVGFGLFD